MGSTIVTPVAPLQTALVDTTGLITRNWWPFFTASQKILTSAYYPVYAAQTYGADPTGKQDTSVPLMMAYAAAVVAGGGTIYLGPGTYYLNSSVVLDGTAPVKFTGAGDATVLVRNSAMPTGQGVFDLQAAANVTFDNMVIDGAVTTPTGLLYSQFNGDPLNPLLTENTSIWLHDGCENIAFTNLTIQHTGGYSVLANAVNLDINTLYFYQFHLLNNRPNWFGVSPTNLIYGAWNSGVLLHGNGVTSSASVNDAHFLSCSAKRVNGTAFWAGHIYGFNAFFDDITFDDMSFEDCARDLIQLGATLGCRINGVRGRRIGYTTSDDTSVSTPAWLVDQWAVAIDTGVSFGTTINDINLTSVCGGCCDLDGMVYTNLDGFSFRNPLPGEPEYIEDSIGTVGFAGAAVAGGPNASYGILEAPSGYGPFAEGSHSVSSGNIINMSAGALRLYGAHSSNYKGIRIWHPPVASGAPVQIGNLGSSNAERSYGNSVGQLHIEWNPATAQPCIVESGGASPFLSTDVNLMLGNEVISSTPGMTAAQKDSNSGSFVSITENIDFSTYHGTLQVTNGFITGS